MYSILKTASFLLYVTCTKRVASGLEIPSLLIVKVSGKEPLDLQDNVSGESYTPYTVEESTVISGGAAGIKQAIAIEL